ncbi:hypothetical protein GCM10025734_04320 [Kitasatospora paranensis]
MLRCAEDFSDGAAFRGAAGVHDEDVVCAFGDDAEVVGDEDDGGAEVALDLREEVEDLRLHGDVQGGGGFVGDEDVGLAHQRHGDHGALAHAAGELVGVAVGP